MSGESGFPKHIETVISNVFLFDTNVYKLYKSYNNFFNRDFSDISERDPRFDFVRRDFEWNHSLSPTVYREIRGVREGDVVEFVDESDAEELVIVMDHVDSKEFLFEKLVDNALSADDARSIGMQLAVTMQRVRTTPVPDMRYFDVFEQRIKDARNWLKLDPESVSVEEADAWCDYLIRFRDTHRETFEDASSMRMLENGDIHTMNALYSGGTLNLMDTYPPKSAWTTDYEFMPMYRMATDLLALGNEQLFDACIDGYVGAGGRIPDRTLDPVFITYAASIAVSYLHSLARSDPTKREAAGKFHSFLRSYFASVS